MYCPYCGTRNDNDDLFCKACGKRLNHPENSASNDSVGNESDGSKRNQDQSSSAPEASKTAQSATEIKGSGFSKQRIIKISALLLAIVLIIVSVVALRIRGKNEEMMEEERPSAGDPFTQDDDNEDSFSNTSEDAEAIASSGCYITTSSSELYISPGESVKLTVYSGGMNLPSEYHFTIDWADVDISTEWGEWLNFTDAELTITGNSISEGTAYVYLVDAQTNERLASCEISIHIDSGTENSACYYVDDIWFSAHGDYFTCLAEAEYSLNYWEWEDTSEVYQIRDDAVFYDRNNSRELDVFSLCEEVMQSGAIYIVTVSFDHEGYISSGEIIWLGYYDGY